MIKIFNYLLVLNVFLGGFVLFSSPFEFYVGYLFIVFFLMVYALYYDYVGINYKFLLLLALLTVCSLVNVYKNNTTIVLISKQLFGILITGSAYYLLIKVNKCDIEKLFVIYLRISLIIAVIGIFQEFSYLIGFKSGYDYSVFIPKWHVADTDWGVLKVNSILLEPAHFATSMAPAFLVSLDNIFRKSVFSQRKTDSIIIVISFILTFSAVAYIAILISLFLISYHAKKIRYTSLAMIVISVLAFSAYSYIPEIRTRVDDTFGIATGSIEATDANLSTFSLVSNAYVAYNSFFDSPLFGHGLGSHPISYDKYVFGVIGGDIQEEVFGINKDDASSLFLRLASETGLFGMVAVLYFVFKCYLKKSSNNTMQMISNSILCMLLVSLLRQGHYFYNGLFFFVWLYYFSYKIYMSMNPEPYVLANHGINDELY